MKIGTLVTSFLLTVSVGIASVAIPILVKADDGSEALRTRILTSVDGQIANVDELVNSMHDRTFRTTATQRSTLSRGLSQEKTELLAFRQGVVAATNLDELKEFYAHNKYTFSVERRFMFNLHKNIFWVYAAENRRDALENDLNNTFTHLRIAKAQGKSTSELLLQAKATQAKLKTVQAHFDAAAIAIIAAEYNNGVSDELELKAIRDQHLAATTILNQVKAEITALNVARKNL
jgi:hypothetical protein